MEALKFPQKKNGPVSTPIKCGPSNSNSISPPPMTHSREFSCPVNHSIPVRGAFLSTSTSKANSPARPTIGTTPRPAMAATAAQPTMAATAPLAAPPAPSQKDGTDEELKTLTNALTMSPEQKILAKEFFNDLVIEECLNDILIELCKTPAEGTEAASFTRSDMEERIDSSAMMSVSKSFANVTKSWGTSTSETKENKKELETLLDGERGKIRTGDLEDEIKAQLTQALSIKEVQISSLTQQVGDEVAATGLIKIQTTEGPDIVVKLSTQDEVRLNKKLEKKFLGEDSPLVIPWGHFNISGTNLVLLFMDEQGKDGLEILQAALNKALNEKKESVLVAVAKKLLNDGLTIINKMHKQDTLHRDPKLPNLVLSSDITLKKIDLSDAAVLQDAKDSTGCNTKKGSFPTYSRKKKRPYTKSDDIEHYLLSVYHTLNSIEVESFGKSLKVPELYKLKAGIGKLLNTRLSNQQTPLNLQKLLEDAQKHQSAVKIQSIIRGRQARQKLSCPT